jgi:hypothetical protein
MYETAKMQNCFRRVLAVPFYDTYGVDLEPVLLGFWGWSYIGYSRRHWQNTKCHHMLCCSKSAQVACRKVASSLTHKNCILTTTFTA